MKMRVLWLLVLLLGVALAPAETLAQGTINTPVGGRTVTGTIDADEETVSLGLGNAPGAGFVLTGSGTWVIVPEVSLDGGATWVVVDAWSLTGEAVTQAITVIGSYQFQHLAGVSDVRVRASSFSSGSVDVTIRATNAPSLPMDGSARAPGFDTPNHAQLAGTTDGTKLWGFRGFDLDTGGGDQVVAGVSLRKSASGGSVELGTSTDPIRVDPTGTTTQPVDVTDRDARVLGRVKIHDGTDTAQVTATAGGSLQVECSTGCGGGTQYAEDTASANAEQLTMTGVKRQDTPATDTDTDGDRTVLKSDSVGRLWVNCGTGCSGGTQYAEDTASTDAEQLTMAGVKRQDTPTTDTTTDGDRTVLKSDSVGRLWINCGTGCGGGTQYAEDTASAADEQLTMAGVVRQDTPTSLVNASGDRTALSVNAQGRLHTIGPSATVTDTITADEDAVTLTLNGAAGVGFVISGTWSATLIPEVSVDCSTYTALDVWSLASESATQSLTINGQFVFMLPMAGLQCARVRADAFTSGTATVTMVGTPTPNVPGWGAERVPGATAPAHAQYVGGLDGSTLRGIKVDASGELQVDVLSVPANQSVNLNQVSGAAVATAASGTQKVGIVGNTGATVDSAVGAASAPTNQVVVGSVFNSTAPAPTAGQAMATQADQAGNLRAVPGIATATLSGWTSATGVNATQTIVSNHGTGAVLLHLVQTSTITGGAITFEVSYDNTNWVTIPADAVLDPASTAWAVIPVPYTLVASTNKPFLLVGKGWQGLRIKLSTAITGTATVTPNYALLAYLPAAVGVANLLTKAEDAVAASGDTGPAPLIVREDTPTATAANGDYIHKKANQFGHQFVAAICNDPNLTTTVAISQTALNGNAELVALTSNQTVYLCGYNFVSSGTANIRLVYGTGTACATGETAITGAYPLIANTGINTGFAGAIIAKAAISNAVCIETSASVNVMGLLQYVKGAFP